MWLPRVLQCFATQRHALLNVSRQTRFPYGRFGAQLWTGAPTFAAADDTQLGVHAANPTSSSLSSKSFVQHLHNPCLVNFESQLWRSCHASILP